MNRFLTALLLATAAVAGCGDDGENKKEAVTCERICDAGAACVTDGTADDWKALCLAECGATVAPCPAAADQDCLACWGDCSTTDCDEACACPDTGGGDLTCQEVCTAIVSCSAGSVTMTDCMNDCTPVAACVATKTEDCRPCLQACDQACVESTCGACNAS